MAYCSLLDVHSVRDFCGILPGKQERHLVDIVPETARGDILRICGTVMTMAMAMLLLLLLLLLLLRMGTITLLLLHATNL